MKRLCLVVALAAASGSAVAQTPPSSSLTPAAVTSQIQSQAVAKAGGDASATVVNLGNGYTPRTMKQRANDRFNVLDYGVVPNATDSTTASNNVTRLSNATSAANAVGGGTVYFPAGVYCLSGGVILYPNSVADFDGGASFSNTGNCAGGTILGVQDALNTGHTLALNTSSDGSGLTSVQAFYLANNATNSIPGYQHNGIYSRVLQYDSSAPGTDHDLVSIFGTAGIAPGVADGRIWAANFVTTIPATSNGYVNGIEIGIQNQGGSSGEPGSNTAKNGIGMFCSGAYSCTSGLSIATADNSGLFEYGLFAFNNAFSDSFIALRPNGNSTAYLYRVSSAGKVFANAGEAITGGLSADTLTLTGSVPQSSVMVGPAGAAGAPAQRKLGVADIAGAAPIASPTFTGIAAFSVNTNIATGGTTQATATALTAQRNTITTCTSGGVSLPTSAQIGAVIDVLDRCGATLTIYPDTASAQIETASAGTPVTIAGTNGGVTGHFMRETSTLWREW